MRRIAISLVVVVVVAGTTAGGLAGALGDLGRSVVSVSVTGRTLAEPEISRSVVQLDDGSFGSELDSAQVAQPLSVASPTTEPSINEETGEARQLSEPMDGAAEAGGSLASAPTANDGSAPPTSKLRDVEFQRESADSAGKLISPVTVPKQAFVQLAIAAEPTPVPGVSSADATFSDLPSKIRVRRVPNRSSTEPLSPTACSTEVSPRTSRLLTSSTKKPWNSCH